MTKEQFFDAFGQIDGAYILAAGDALYGKAETARVSYKKLVRTLIIAAVIAALLTLTAYAAGWFGLAGRVINDPGGSALPGEAGETVDRLRTVHHRDYVSLGGVIGSAEYQAAAEWLAFKGEYADRKTAEQTEQGQPYYEWRDLERSFAPDAETKEICRLYQVWDGTMWAKLQEIAARYGLALHTERRAIENAGDQSREHGAYEDGSFHISASAVVEQERYLYELYLEKNGCLPCDDMTAGAACEYEEWEYTTGRGDKVSIAVRDVSTNGAWAQYELLVFYSGDGAVMTIRASYGCQRGDSDEKLFAEILADSIDFSAVAGSDTPENAVLILKGN